MAKQKKKTEGEEFVNPINPDHITDRPGTLPYAHTRGGVVIKPEDKGKLKGRALAAMYDQTERQMQQIYEQVEVLLRQAKALQVRKRISELIYTAEMGFEPVVGKEYHLYRRSADQYVLSLVAPEEWGKSIPYEAYCATARLLSDHTWEVLKATDDFEEVIKDIEADEE